jgi:hypothetical protein
MSAQHKSDEITVSPNLHLAPRKFDYSATRDGSDLIGYGETPEAAVADLLDQEWKHE